MTIDVDFEPNRPQLTAVAFRLLGSMHDAEDAVQTTWIKAWTAETPNVRNIAAWLTTVLTRVCLDELRKQHRRGERPLLADAIAAEDLQADERYLQRENISRALMVVLDRLTPPQRVAYVLHDLFDVPFRDVADTLDITVDNAKKQASRARQRIQNAQPSAAVNDDARAVADAFLAAASGADFNQMLTLMNSDCTRVVDPSLLPPGIQHVVAGARAVAEETVLFADRIRSSTPMVVGGAATYVIAPGGHLLATLAITVTNQRVNRIEIAKATAHTPIAAMSAT